MAAAGGTRGCRRSSPASSFHRSRPEAGQPRSRTGRGGPGPDPARIPPRSRQPPGPGKILTVDKPGSRFCPSVIISYYLFFLFLYGEQVMPLNRPGLVSKRAPERGVERGNAAGCCRSIHRGSPRGKRQEKGSSQNFGSHPCPPPGLCPSYSPGSSSCAAEHRVGTTPPPKKKKKK